MKTRYLIMIMAGLISLACCSSDLQPTRDDGTWFFLPPADLQAGAHHTRHAEIFGKYVQGFNLAILQGIDIVQAHALDGGTYFVGKDSIPAESPVYYDLALFGQPLIKAPRHASYCSGATYTAFMEALNLLQSGRAAELTPERFEALRMQEPDGGRREDMIKAWGYWNADGFGTHFSLVQYLGMGDAIKPAQLRPGDFINVSWKSGLGHSVIFLGWVDDPAGKKLLYWSSQRATNGYGDQMVPVSRIMNLKAVRLMRLEGLFEFDPGATVNTEVQGDSLDWK